MIVIVMIVIMLIVMMILATILVVLTMQMIVLTVCASPRGHLCGGPADAARTPEAQAKKQTSKQTRHTHNKHTTQHKHTYTHNANTQIITAQAQNR